MNLTEIRSGLLVKDGRTLLQVSTIYPPVPERGGEGFVTAEVVEPVQPRTTVRTYSLEHIELHWRHVTDREFARYNAMMDARFAS